jgi:Cys-tRNA(Pro)/Cys-tRNA(Cys) deacylase
VSAPTRALVALEALGVAHVVHRFEADGAEGGYGLVAAQMLGVDDARVFKTLLASVDGRAVVAVVPVASRLSTKAVAAALGAKRCEMMAPRDAERLTGYVVGGISPFGQRTRLATVVDGTALSHPTVFVSAGRRGLDVELDPNDLVAACSATIASITA